MPDWSGFITSTILIDGKPYDDLEVTAIDVTHEVNRIPSAMIAFVSTTAFIEDSPLSAGNPFAPAAPVEIKLRNSDGDEASIFTGVVTTLGLRTQHDGHPTLEVVVKDKAVRLAGARHSKIWVDATDSDAIRDIVKSPLTFGDAPDTQPTHKTLVQYEATDWDFILSRADALGLAVVVGDGIVSLKKMEVGAAAYTFSAFDGILDFQFELDAATQSPSLSGMIWDPGQLAAAAPADAAILKLAQGKIGNNTVGDKLGFGPAHLTHMVPLPAAEAKAWAASRMGRSRLALIRGRISLAGLPAARPMEVANLKGLGERFDGDALITGVRHRVDSRGFTTDLQFGLAPEPVGRLADIADMAAGGLLPPISGLQLGTVTDTADPDGQARVKVAVPAILTDPAGSLWARILTPDAGKNRGFCFLPETGDEVLVGFLDHDPRHPVILGALHGAKNVLPDGFKDTKQKGIVAKSSARIVFSEGDKPSITISTPDGRKLILNDDAKTITVADGHNNKITLDANGITIESGQDLSLKAKGAVKVSGASIDLN